LAPDLERDRRVRLDPAAAAAVRTGLRERALQTLAHPLARHLDQAELRDLQDLRLRSVLADLDLERLEQARTIGQILHVDEVEHDDPAKVAQADLPDDLARGLEIRFEDGLLEILLADVLSRVHVDRDERLCLIDDDVAAGLEPHLRFERLGDFTFDAEVIEDRLFAGIEPDARDEVRLDLIEELDDALVLIDRVDPDALELRGENVADRAQDEIEI